MHRGKIIALASTKGGCGKSTTALTVAQTFAHLGAKVGTKVTIIDTDRMGFCYGWATSMLEDPDRKGLYPANLNIIRELDTENIPKAIDEAAATSDIVIVDYEGTANMSVATSIVKADLIILPLRLNKFDVAGSLEIIELINAYKEAFPDINPDIRILLNFQKVSINPVSGRQYLELFENIGIKRFKINLRDNHVLAMIVNEFYTINNVPNKYKDAAQKMRQNLLALVEEIAVVLSKQPELSDDESRALDDLIDKDDKAVRANA